MYNHCTQNVTSLVHKLSSAHKINISCLSGNIESLYTFNHKVNIIEYHDNSYQLMRPMNKTPKVLHNAA